MFRPKHTALAAAATVMALGGAGVAIAAGGGNGSDSAGAGTNSAKTTTTTPSQSDQVSLRSRPERVRRLSDTTAGALRGAGGLLGDVAARSRYVGFSIEMGTS